MLFVGTWIIFCGFFWRAESIGALRFALSWLTDEISHDSCAFQSQKRHLHHWTSIRRWQSRSRRERTWTYSNFSAASPTEKSFLLYLDWLTRCHMTVVHTSMNKGIYTIEHRSECNRVHLGENGLGHIVILALRVQQRSPFCPISIICYWKQAKVGTD